MVLAMRPVIDFLNAVDREHDMEAADTTDETLQARVEKAKPKSVEALALNKTFDYPKGPKAPRAGRIAYTKAEGID